MKDKLYFGDPNQKDKWHIFKEDGRSLCGRWAMFRKFDDDDLVKEGSRPNHNDCKICFKKLNVLEEKSEVKDE